MKAMGSVECPEAFMAVLKLEQLTAAARFKAGERRERGSVDPPPLSHTDCLAQALRAESMGGAQHR